MENHSTALLLSGFLFAILTTIVCVYPYYRIIRRTGHSGWWVLTMALPVGNVIMLWVFAFVRWPAVDDKQAR